MSEFALGDRVIFTNNIYDYVVGKSNPLQGTKFACQGTIGEFDGDLIWVRWDNDFYMDYYACCLELVENFQEIAIPDLKDLL